MFYRYLNIVPASKPVCHIFSHRNGAMLTTGTAYRKGCKRFVLACVPSQHCRQRVFVAVHKLLCQRIPRHIVAHGLVFTAELSQAFLPVGIGQKAHVGNHVNVGRQAVLVAKADDGEANSGILGFTIDFRNGGGELVDVHF